MDKQNNLYLKDYIFHKSQCIYFEFHQPQQNLKIFSQIAMIQAPTIDYLPILSAQRQRTDTLCTYFTTLFAILLFGGACLRLNPTNLYRLAYPTDIEGRACGLDFPNFPYVYRTSLTDPSKRLCVNKCPKYGDNMLSCIPSKTLSCKQNHHPAFQVVIYDSQLESTRAGLFCVPTDPVIRNQLAKAASPIDNRMRFYSLLDSLKVVFIAALALGFIYLFVMQCFPIGMPRIMIGLGTAGLIVVVIFTILTSPDIFRILSAFKYVFVVVLAMITFMLLFNTIKHPIELRLCSILLKYASMVVSQSCTILIYVLFALAAVAAVFALGIFQIFCFWSGGDLIKDSFSTFYHSQSLLAKIMSGVVLFECVWALFFLKQAYNLLLSGYGINWYFYAGGMPKAISPLMNLLCFHWGSVAGGSFLSMIFWFPSLILDHIVPSRNQTITSGSIIHKVLFQCCYGIQGFFDLCRTEAFAYINLTGLPYCNSCRYVEYVSENTGIYAGSKSMTRIYLLGAHSFLISICIIVGIAYLEWTQHTKSFALILIVIILSYFLTTYFISFHAYIADGILVTLLTEEYLAGGYSMIVRAPIDLKQEAFLLLNRPVQLAQ